MVPIFDGCATWNRRCSILNLGAQRFPLSTEETRKTNAESRDFIMVCDLKLTYSHVATGAPQARRLAPISPFLIFRSAKRKQSPNINRCNWRRRGGLVHQHQERWPGKYAECHFP
ncbi:hypothetical protein Hypma_001325 [Hypsizygus marmoreus]|uniref:Uncharacterized protein n=1 Tax=Hypsizygus marmoreus TaxID=39966 RepID=A0A369K690_HYPMA|nr:hypothetical protein Hypma_001325 [Hypsizygus marmoreus]